MCIRDSIGAERDGPYVIGMAREAAQAAPGFHIPQANRVFLATRSQKLPIGAEGDGEDRILAAGDAAQFVPACGIPKLDGTIVVGRS